MKYIEYSCGRGGCDDVCWPGDVERIPAGASHAFTALAVGLAPPQRLFLYNDWRACGELRRG